MDVINGFLSMCIGSLAVSFFVMVLANNIQKMLVVGIGDEGGEE